jgi:hypothetical protein
MPDDPYPRPAREPFDEVRSMEEWVNSALLWGQASQAFVTCSTELSLSSRNLAQGLGASYDALPAQLRHLADTVEDNAAEQRLALLPIATAISELHSLHD